MQKNNTQMVQQVHLGGGGGGFEYSPLLERALVLTRDIKVKRVKYCSNCLRVI